MNLVLNCISCLGVLTFTCQHFRDTQPCILSMTMSTGADPGFWKGCVWGGGVGGGGQVTVKYRY